MPPSFSVYQLDALFWHTHLEPCYGTIPCWPHLRHDGHSLSKHSHHPAHAFSPPLERMSRLLSCREGTLCLAELHWDWCESYRLRLFSIHRQAHYGFHLPRVQPRRCRQFGKHPDGAGSSPLVPGFAGSDACMDAMDAVPPSSATSENPSTHRDVLPSCHSCLPAGDPFMCRWNARRCGEVNTSHHTQQRQ